MRRPEALADRVAGLSTLVVAGMLAAAQLVVVALLASREDWTYSSGHALAGAALMAAEAVLLYGFAVAFGGRLFGMWAGVLWIVAPIFFLRYWSTGGNPPVDFGAVYRGQFLRAAFGFEARSAVAAGCLLLASGWLALGQRRPGLLLGAAAGAAVGAAALVHPRLWPALAAPVLALAVARRPRAALACLAVVLAALGALALFRTVPGAHLSHHGIGKSLDLFREYSWSRRLLEYLPLAGLVGVARRSWPAFAFLGWLFVSVICVTLTRQLPILPLTLALIPALPVYALLTASIVFLVPRPRTAPATAPARSS